MLGPLQSSALAKEALETHKHSSYFSDIAFDEESTGKDGSIHSLCDMKTW